MNNVMKGFVLAAVILYTVSPLDVVPGPIDDILVLALGLAARKELQKQNKKGERKMNTKWNYAYHVQRVHQAGGPEAFMKKIRQSSFDAGYLTGRSEGLQTGILCMVPFVAGTGYLLYEKAPGIWKKIKDKVRTVQEQVVETLGFEKKEPKRKVDVLCTHCMGKVLSVKEVPEWYYRERFRCKDLMRHTTCPHCGEDVRY